MIRLLGNLNSTPSTFTLIIFEPKLIKALSPDTDPLSVLRIEIGVEPQLTQNRNKIIVKTRGALKLVNFIFILLEIIIIIFKP
jgi:hypothetical protein